MGAVMQTASHEVSDWIIAARRLAELKDAAAEILARAGHPERAQSVRRAAYILRRQADKMEARC